MDEYEVVLLKELPASLKDKHWGARLGGISKWKWLHDRIITLRPEMPVARFRMANKKEAQSAQSSINGTSEGKRKVAHPMNGYRFFTRTEPVASKDGEYFLYVGIEQSSTKH